MSMCLYFLSFLSVLFYSILFHSISFYFIFILFCFILSYLISFYLVFLFYFVSTVINFNLFFLVFLIAFYFHLLVVFFIFNTLDWIYRPSKWSFNAAFLQHFNEKVERRCFCPPTPLKKVLLSLKLPKITIDILDSCPIMFKKDI